MKKGTAFPLVLTAFLAIAVLYAPQPLLPRFAAAYGITETRAALLVAVVLFPLSVAPLSFGALMQRWPSARVLQGSMGGLAVLVAAQAVVPSFAIFVGIRLLQGIAVAAILTALMTHIATFARSGTMPRIMAWYVAATILGGFLGRVLAGLAAAYASWSFFSLALSGCIALGGLALLRLQQEPPEDADSSDEERARFRDVLRTPRYLRVYALIFCLYFSFSAFMNFLPFRLQVVRPGASELLTGLLYGGYVAGIGVSLKAPALARWIGGEAQAAWIGTAIGVGALLVAYITATWALFGAVVFMCIAMFMTHSIAAGWVNRAGGSRGSLINGLYVAVYYAGGVLGAYVPGFAYEHVGWGAFLIVLGAMLVGAQGAAWRWWRVERTATSGAEL